MSHLTDTWLGPYCVEIDDSGDEVLSLEGEWSLPPEYRKREVELALENHHDGHERHDMLISRNTLHAATQEYRASLDPPWGERFVRDPRPFSSTPRPKGAA